MCADVQVWMYECVYMGVLFNISHENLLTNIIMQDHIIIILAFLRILSHDINQSGCHREENSAS